MVLLKEPKLDHMDNQIIRSIWWNSGFRLVSNMAIWTSGSIIIFENCNSSLWNKLDVMEKEFSLLALFFSDT